jgi:hypothetical protein
MSPDSSVRAEASRLLDKKLDHRIQALVNRGAEICPDYDLPPDLSLHGCKRCGYTADVHLLRDSRRLLRALLAEGPDPETVFPRSANGGTYSVRLDDLGRLMDALREVAQEDDMVETVRRIIRERDEWIQDSETITRLQRYVQHLPDCPALPANVDRFTWNGTPIRDCNCGLAASQEKA